jgi:hypothetical protein
LSLSNTATPIYYGHFRDEVLAGRLPVCAEVAMEMERIDALIADPAYYYDGSAINGFIKFCEGELNVSNVTVTGELTADVVICEGMLAIKAGAKVEADEIRYRSLTIEDGAVVLGTMGHLDHVSQGEQV